MPGAVHTNKGNIFYADITEAMCPCCTLHYLSGSTVSHCDNIGFVVLWQMYTNK